MKKTLKIIAEVGVRILYYYTLLVVVFVNSLLICLALFGGSVEIQINWETLTNLIKLLNNE